MMLTCREPFTEAKSNNKYWLRWTKDPVRSIQLMKINIAEDALDLIVGMTKEEPNDRFTMDDIIAHKWFQGETASQ